MQSPPIHMHLDWLSELEMDENRHKARFSDLAFDSPTIHKGRRYGGQVYTRGWRVPRCRCRVHMIFVRSITLLQWTRLIDALATVLYSINVHR